MISRIATAAGLLLLTALSVARVSRTPAPVAANAPDTVFSAERALRHVAQIAQRPHAMGMPDHDRVRDYILRQLNALGVRASVETTTAVGTRYQASGRVQNIVGVLPGRNAGENKPVVLLMAHYDGVEAGPAAADDGAGVAAILETLRALKARREPLANDVVALITDGEESGLLGAAAFVRENPLAKRIGVALNFEARGTTGRSLMFETGPGNLDAVRMLREARDVTAGSVFTTIYRILPNDTDLSELAVLGVPAMNFAFADGVERYHTTRDDFQHLDPGSVQHHGLQMLALARAFGDAPMPRPKTGDAVFFDFPFVGLVVYPTAIAIPLAVLLLVLVVLAMRRERDWKGVVAGLVAMVVTIAALGAASRFLVLSGPAMWSGRYATAIALAALAINGGVYLAVDRRHTNAPATAALLVWSAAGIALSVMLPAVSYVFVWPALFAAVARWTRNPIAEWIAAFVTLMMIAGAAYIASAVMLGVSGVGAIALVVLTSLVVWLIAPVVARVTADWSIALAGTMALAVLVAFYARATVRQTAEHPARSALVYLQRADSSEAFFGSLTPREPWTQSVVGTSQRGPDWSARVSAGAQPLIGRPVPSAHLDAPTATLVSDSGTGERVVTFRVRAPTGTTGLVVRANGVVTRASIDGRAIDTTRFRRQSRTWSTEYWNVPSDGALFALTVPAGQPLELELSARRPELPATIEVPPRPANVVASQTGDVSVVRRMVKF